MKLKNDGPLWISTGRHRMEKSWKVRELLWSELAEQLITPVKTNETYKEYLEMPVDGQAAVKDVGGFVGGTISGGRRKKGSVVTRQLLTFDLDYAPLDFMNDLELLFSCSMLVYSTHKHSPVAPRWRLVIPLDREVMPDEYQAIARKVSEIIKIDWFDPTTYQPERLMYWPSVSADTQLVTWVQDGPWMKADEILSMYKEWSDLSQWPIHPLENKHIESDRRKQEDPLEKKGLVGVFCRCYSISEAIEKFLSTEYVDTGVDGRYSYVHGSTALGVVTYDDKFSYSHHATDPSSGMLCNAFDLVRMHKFKDLDDKADDRTPINRMPSFLAMADLCRDDEAVRLRMGSEKLAGVIDDFKIIGEEQGIEVNLEWLKEMEVDRKGNYLGTIQNILLILRNDPQLKGAIWYDEFNHQSIVKRKLPWHKRYVQDQDVTDADLSGLRWYLESVYSISQGTKMKDALELILHENRVHPVREYLSGLKWDGTRRLARVMIDYLGSEETPYVMEVTRKSLIACVARVFQPGIKFDNVLTIIGDQGIGKSTILSKLGGAWHSDSFGSVKSKEAAEQLRGVWIMEIGELAALKKAEVEEIKLFISKQHDRFRPAFGINVVKYSRQTVFFGTSNEDTPLQDASGGRRFWPVSTMDQAPHLDVFNVSQDTINQIWAEAAYYYWEGEELHLSRELEESAKVVQKSRLQQDDRADAIIRYLNLKLPLNWNDMNIYKRQDYIRHPNNLEYGEGETVRTEVTVAEIWVEALGGALKDINRYSTKPIHDIMRSLENWKFTSTRRRDPTYGRQFSYVRTGDNEAAKSRAMDNENDI